MRINAGDTAWVLASAALVLFMTPGLALFYGGMVRAKNVLGMLMQNFFCMGLVSVLWAAIAYSLAFSGSGKYIGNLDLAWMKDVATTSPTGFKLSIPPLSFSAFQTHVRDHHAGADHRRDRRPHEVLRVVLVPRPLADPRLHAGRALGVLARGLAVQAGALDFAGGTVVHINAGIAALAAVLVIGRRKGGRNIRCHPTRCRSRCSAPGILWFGWFGFNAGSALAANGIAAQAFVNTNMAAAAGMLAWLLVERIKGGHATTLGAASGAVAGLVAITPCAGFVGGMAPIYIGLVAGSLCFFACSIKFKFGYDDALDVIGVHLVGGIAGSLMVGLFADAAYNPSITDNGLFNGGGWSLMGEQVIAVGATLVWSFVLTFAILKVLQLVMPGGIRVSEEDEQTGLDLTQHSEVGYSLDRV